MRKIAFILAVLCAAVICCWGSDFLLDGGDPARTGWVKNETILNASNVKDLKLLWKTHLDSTPRQMHNLFPPMVAEHVQTANGVKAIGVVSGVSNDVYGIDLSEGEQVWHVKLDSTYADTPGGRGGSALCPGGQTDVPAIGPGSAPGQYVVYTVGWDGRLFQLNLADGKEVAPPQLFMPSNAKPQALELYKGTIYTSNTQGCGGNQNGFYSFNLATNKASVFLPAGGGLWGRRGVSIDSNGVAYMGTGDGNFYPDKKELGDAIVGVKLDDNAQLQLASYFGPPDANWMHGRDLDVNVTPVPFDYKGKHFLVDSSKQCRVWLLDRDNLGGADHQTALYRSPLLCNDDQTWDSQGVWGAISEWQDPQGNAWIIVPFWGPVSATFHAQYEPSPKERPVDGGFAAYKVEQKNGKWELTPVWLSENMAKGEEALIANGVVFAYASGEDTNQRDPDVAYTAQRSPQDTGGQSSIRIAGSTHVTIYALDGQTGKELWSSGNQITSFNHFSGITLVNGRIYISTFAGDVYCFGIARQQ
jgi:outer membrane protein assembly factor BamB